MADRSSNDIELSDQVGTEQYGRKYKLVVFGSSTTGQDQLSGLDLSPLRFKFSIKRTSSMTPNVAEIRVYNMDPRTVAEIGANKEFNKVVVEAGYQGNYGVIFEGNIKQIIAGRESATDTFVDIMAGDGDRAFNYAVVNQTLAAGSSPESQIAAAIQPMQDKGVTPGLLGDFNFGNLPRGKTMWGNSKDFMRSLSQTYDKTWSIQDGKIFMVDKTGYLPGERVVLTSKTGLIGTPEQTTEGTNIKCLLNPLLRCNNAVEINNASVQQLKIDLTNPKNPVNVAAPLSADGVYFILSISYEGDTRGVPWYCNLVTLRIDPTTNLTNSVSNG